MEAARRQGTMEDYFKRRERAYEHVHPEVRFAASDDLGNRHRSMPEGGGGSWSEWVGSSRFWPGLDPAAARLTLEASLGWRRFGDLPRGKIDVGPEEGAWSFDVDLTIGRDLTVIGDDR
jgi:hypothetical protein